MRTIHKFKIATLHDCAVCVAVAKIQTRRTFDPIYVGVQLDSIAVDESVSGIYVWAIVDDDPPHVLRGGHGPTDPEGGHRSPGHGPGRRVRLARVPGAAMTKTIRTVRWSKVVRSKLIVIMRERGPYRNGVRWRLELCGVEQSSHRTLLECREAARSLEWHVLRDRGPLRHNRSYRL